MAEASISLYGKDMFTITSSNAAEKACDPSMKPYVAVNYEQQFCSANRELTDEIKIRSVFQNRSTGPCSCNSGVNGANHVCWQTIFPTSEGGYLRSSFLSVEADCSPSPGVQKSPKFMGRMSTVATRVFLSFGSRDLSNPPVARLLINGLVYQRPQTRKKESVASSISTKYQFY